MDIKLPTVCTQVPNHDEHFSAKLIVAALVQGFTSTHRRFFLNDARFNSTNRRFLLIGYKVLRFFFIGARFTSTDRRFFRQLTCNRWTDQTLEMGVDPAMLAVLSLGMAEGRVQPETLSLDGEPNISFFALLTHTDSKRKALPCEGVALPINLLKRSNHNHQKHP